MTGIMRHIILVPGLLLLTMQSVSTQTIRVHVENIWAATGKLYVAVFDSQESFKTEKPVFETVLGKSAMTGGALSCEIPFRKGQFGIAVYDDANDNGKMDYYYFRIPSEGFGFSNYLSKGFNSPQYKDFSFTLDENESKKVRVLLRYIGKNKSL